MKAPNVVAAFVVIACTGLVYAAVGRQPVRLQADEPAVAQSPLPPALDGPLAPAKAAESFRLESGLRLELVAAEPLVASPVALAFDERGRLFVAENHGYPTGPGEGQPPAGKIALLEDTNGDGRMDQRTNFAEGLTFPNGLLPWAGGLIVTCAPEILYLKDTDGDGKADERQVWFRGFATGGSTQLRVSHPTLGLDNWIYVTSGLTGGEVTSPVHAGRLAVKLGRTDFRFRPDLSEFEPADGGAQFGLTFDDFGRRFVCYNRVQVQHVVLPSRVLLRNPHLAFSETTQDCPAELKPEPLRGHGAAAPLFPISQNMTTADSHAGTFTAACAVTVWRGSNLPEVYREGVFSCDPTGNLVHFDRLVPNGATFSARRVRDGIEFLASTDNWFRPVFLAHGPDGALYVCDMYRKTIEHPDYLPIEIRKRTDFESGKTMGRIWRVVSHSSNAKSLRSLRCANLAEFSTVQLCESLSRSDGWWRDTAQRLLLERRDAAAVPRLKQLVSATERGGVAAAHALNLLHEFTALDDDLLRKALQNPAAGVRELALQLVEPRLAAHETWLEPVLSLAADNDARVRFVAAQTLGASQDRRTVSPLARIAVRAAADRWTRAAVLSSLAGQEVEFLHELLADLPARPGVIELMMEFGRLLAASQAEPCRSELVGKMLAPRTMAFEHRAALLTGFAETLRNRGVGRDAGVFPTVLASDQPPVPDTRQQLRHAFADALAIALDVEQSLNRRRAAVELLAFADFTTAGPSLLRLVEPLQAAAVQSVAIRSVATQRDDQIAATLVSAERFSAYSPALREEVLSALLSNPQHHPGLLDAIESGVVPAGALDSLRRKQLTEHRDATIKQRAQRLFAATGTGDRAKVYEEFKSVLEMTPDAENGRKVFKQECATCHRLDRDGFPVGPDLFGIRNQPKAAILLHILIPEQEITPGFAAFVVSTKDGRVHTGLITAETSTSLTLRQALGKEETILRTDIDEILSSNLSLMPQGVERVITKQGFADLLAYLIGEAQSSAR